MRISLSLLTLCALLAACGQKGDLYLPERARETVPATASPATGSAAEEVDAERRRQQQAAGAAADAD